MRCGEKHASGARNYDIGGKTMKKLLFLAPYAPGGKVLDLPQTPRQKRQAQENHQICEALKRLDYDFFSTDDIDYLIVNGQEYDMVWSLYSKHKSREFVPSLCRLLKLEYIGATPYIRTLTTDKNLSKQLARHMGMDTAEWVIVSGTFGLPEAPPFSGPYFVKPRFGVVTVDIDETCICKTWSSAISKAEQYFADDSDAIIERFVDGTEYGITIVNTVDKNPIISAPYDTDNNLCPHESLTKMLHYFASQYFLQMQPCDYVYLTFLVDNKSGVPYFLGANDMMSLNLEGVPVSSLLSGCFKTYDDLIRHIMELGIARLNAKRGLAQS